ncbi:MAG: hypothetical protein KC503_09360 [Myxococcales bacterium]|nr:hypothetical protein [Myxococcales bacterium]
MKKLAALLFVPALALATIGCGDSGTTVQPDGVKPTPDGGTDTTAPPAQLDCAANTCSDFVAATLSLPADQNQASELGYDYDKDGLPDNALGGILSGLAGVLQGVDLQANLNEVFNEGSTIILMKVQANDFTNETNAAAQAFLGEKVDCCPTDKDPTACAAESKTTCFGGSFSFKVDAASAGTKAIFGGTITGGALSLGPSSLSLKLPIAGAEINLVLQQARIQADAISATSITGGKITGGISQQDLNTGVIPAIAGLVDGLVKDPNTSQSTKDQILNLFDTDKDGTVTTQEVADNSLIQTFLSGDVDVDGDGNLDLTLGVGFTGVAATITGL